MRLIGGLPFALAAGVAFAWGFDAVTASARRDSISSGARFGAVMAGTLVPATIFKTVLRLNGLHVGDTFEMAAAIVLALASGAAAGWLLARRRDASLAVAAASLTMMLASGGPLPVAQSARGAWLAFAFVPICLTGGIVTAALRARLDRSETS